MSKHFDEVYAAVTTTLAFDKGWKNDTGYLDKFVHADVGLRPGDMAKFIDDYGRRAVAVGTRHGNVVVFERYLPTAPDNKSGTIVGNYPDKIRGFYSGLLGVGSTISEAGVEHLLGNTWMKHADNVGHSIEKLCG